MVLWLRWFLGQRSLLLMWRKLFWNVFRNLLWLIWTPFFHFRRRLVIRRFEFCWSFGLFSVLRILRCHLFQSFLHKLLKSFLSFLSWRFLIWRIILFNIFRFLFFELNFDWLTGNFNLFFWNKFDRRRFKWISFQAWRSYFIFYHITFVFFEIWACKIWFSFLSLLMFL